MDTAAFQFHDLSEFPLVIARYGDTTAGLAQTWVGEMERLAESDQDFVMVSLRLDGEVDAEARKTMVLWQTDNMSRMRRHCRGYVAVEPRADELAAMRKRAQKMTRAFEVPFVVEATMEEARATARALLSQPRR